MNTASNWPMGSTLAQLNLELQTTPLAVSKVSGDKTRAGLTAGLKIVSSQSAFASLITQPMSLSITSKAGPPGDVTKWSQTR
ncbi:MAG: hypothetical protein NTW52_03445 [Planctomycetota bacterium]|nr:hypothetical protein [Planctomycetota bacterium]